MSDTITNAILLIPEVRSALANGTKHYRKSDGELLTTDKDIIKALLEEGKIIFEPAPQ